MRIWSCRRRLSRQRLCSRRLPAVKRARQQENMTNQGEKMFGWSETYMRDRGRHRRAYGIIGASQPLFIIKFVSDPSQPSSCAPSSRGSTHISRPAIHSMHQRSCKPTRDVGRQQQRRRRKRLRRDRGNAAHRRRSLRQTVCG